MKETERQEFVYMDEFGNETAGEAGNMEEFIQETLGEADRDPKNPSFRFQVHTGECGGACWESLGHLGYECCVGREPRPSRMTGQLSAPSRRQDERPHPNDLYHQGLAQVHGDRRHHVPDGEEIMPPALRAGAEELREKGLKGKTERRRPPSTQAKRAG